MNKHIKLFLILNITFCSIAFAQENTFTDPRDGQIYKTIKIKDKIWLAENLRFETANSYCPNFNKKKENCENGNFYPNFERDSICPPGWEIPSFADWETYFESIKTDSFINSLTTVTSPNNWIFTEDTLEILNLFDTNNPLNLKPTGWIQGKRKRKIKNATIWMIGKETTDLKFHLHIGRYGFMLHSHTHHIVDKKRKNRKFNARCVFSVN